MVLLLLQIPRRSEDSLGWEAAPSGLAPSRLITLGLASPAPGFPLPQRRLRLVQRASLTCVARRIRDAAPRSRCLRSSWLVNILLLLQKGSEDIKGFPDTPQKNLRRNKAGPEFTWHQEGLGRV
ncbi:Hypothetical predicted protein [Podarcis lilfordi]|uniref:Uncharacterized protein n=1 Tax=Podarcis lilfordi TaxID=74358 RepID=A0AA35KWM8_9SAUR|nr:Hypothetical predicted protein [Podarcis lilfordi]